MDCSSPRAFTPNAYELAPPSSRKVLAVASNATWADCAAIVVAIMTKVMPKKAARKGRLSVEISLLGTRIGFGLDALAIIAVEICIAATEVPGPAKSRLEIQIGKAARIGRRTVQSTS